MVICHVFSSIRVGFSTAPMCELCISAVVTTCASPGGAAIQQQPGEGTHPTCILPVVFWEEDGFYFFFFNFYSILETEIIFFKIFAINVLMEKGRSKISTQ